MHSCAEAVSLAAARAKVMPRPKMRRMHVRHWSQAPCSSCTVLLQTRLCCDVFLWRTTSPVTRRSMPVQHTVAEGHATGALKRARDMFWLSPAHGCHAQGSCGPSLHSAALLGSQSVGEGKPVGKLQLASAAVCSTHAMGVTSEYLLRAASMLVHVFHHLGWLDQTRVAPISRYYIYDCLHVSAFDLIIFSLVSFFFFPFMIILYQ